MVREREAAFGHTMTLQPTPPASVRSRLLCRRESVARLAKSGSFVALRAACAGARASQAASIEATNSERRATYFKIYAWRSAFRYSRSARRRSSFHLSSERTSTRATHIQCSSPQQQTSPPMTLMIRRLPASSPCGFRCAASQTVPSLAFV